MMQQSYKQYDKGEITYNQLRDNLKKYNLDVPPQAKFKNFKEFTKGLNEPKKSIPQITINLQNQMLQTQESLESPRLGRRVVTLQDASPIRKNGNSYIFNSSKKPQDLNNEERDSRLISGNIYLEKKGKVQQENKSPITLKSVFTSRKNSGSISDKNTEKRFLFKVMNINLVGSGDIIKNQYENPVKIKKINHLQCSKN